MPQPFSAILIAGLLCTFAAGEYAFARLCDPSRRWLRLRFVWLLIPVAAVLDLIALVAQVFYSVPIAVSIVPLAMLFFSLGIFFSYLAKRDGLRT